MDIHAIIIDGKECTNKAELFNTFKNKLNFPDYFGENWDSFEEIVNDLSLPQHTVILISFCKSLLSENKEDKLIFKDIIKNSNEENDYKFYKVMPFD